MNEDPAEASRAQWAGVASGWARAAGRREGGPSGAAADWMLRAAQLAPGERVLELACGAGDVGLRAAEAVGPTGRVLCSDFAEPMVQVAGQRAQELGLEQVETRVLDAQEPLPEEERFDAVLCRFGYMLMSDPGRALRAGWSALDRDGRLALAVWGPAKRNPWLSLITDAVMKTLGAPPPEPGMPGPFALADEDRLRGLLNDAGFGDVVVEQVEAQRRHDSLHEWWAETLEVSGPIGALLGQLEEAQVSAIRERAMRGARGHVAGDGSVSFPALIVGAAARRPAA